VLEPDIGQLRVAQASRKNTLGSKVHDWANFYMRSTRIGLGMKNNSRVAWHYNTWVFQKADLARGNSTKLGKSKPKCSTTHQLGKHTKYFTSVRL